jgi:hypothetical protein
MLEATPAQQILVDCNPAPLKNSRRHAMYLLRVLRDYFSMKERKESGFVLHVICGSNNQSEANERIFKLIQSVQSLVNGDS